MPIHCASLLTDLNCYPGIQLRLPCTPGQFFMGAKWFYCDQLNAKQSCPKKMVRAMLKRMVSMATHSGFENGGMPTELLISKLLLILDY